jgi:hypothetical protein
LPRVPGPDLCSGACCIVWFAALAAWQARRAAGQQVTRPPVRPGTGKQARKARARLDALQDQAAAQAGQVAEAGNQDKAAKIPQRNLTDPGCRTFADSR